MEPLNYHHLRYFWQVAECGSLARACERLRLTPQTVSAQLRQLEASLGEQLFDRSGRRLVLTDAGKLAYRHAKEIFSTGEQLVDALRGRSTSHPRRLLVGVCDVVPKLIAYRLLEPATKLDEPVQLVCLEGKAERLLAQLAVHSLDVVISDAPVPPGFSVGAFNHLLGECGVTIMGTSGLARAYRRGFPTSLQDAPFLVPSDETVLRRSLERWFAEHDLRPQIAGQFEDSALLKVFGQAGAGVFAVPSAIADEVRRQFKVHPIGVAHGMLERFFVVSVERQVRHPAVVAICDTARAKLFA